jgi:gas vesicle protein
MNGRQLGINDEKIFLDFICSNMKKGGKKSRDRYIFAVNQLDAFKPNPDDDGEECIEKALTSVRNCLNERGIKDANIFPVTAGVALEKRIDDEDEELLHPFYKKAKKYEAMRLNEYYHFSHQPLSVRELIAKEMEDLDSEDKIEYYSGIRNIEEAIRLYINKYARTTKVCDLVLSFRSQLTELATMAKLEDSIRRDADFKKRLGQEIAKAKSLISSSQTTKSFTDEVERSNYTSEAEKDIVKAISDAKRNFRELVSGKGHQVPVATAQSQSRTIENQFNQSAAQINVRVNSIIQNSFKTILSKVISQYIGHLNGLGITPQSLNLSTYSGVTVSLPDMGKSLKKNTSTKDESYIKQIEQVDWVEGNKTTYGSWGVAAGASFGAALGSALPGLGTLAGALIGGIAGLFGGRASGHDSYYETKYVPTKIEKFVDYVDMQEVASSASHEFDILMDKLEDKAHHYIITENDRLKKSIKDKIKEVDALLLKKLNDLQSLENSDKQTAEVIAKKENDRKWLTSIQARVDNLIEF